MTTATKLTAANQARKEKALNKLFRFNNQGVKSFKQLIDAGVFSKSKTELVPALKYNRAKFNNMSNMYGEQDEYYRRCTENTKTEYSLVYKELWKGKYESSTEVSKFVYDYFNEKENSEKCFECKEPRTDMQTNYGTDDFYVCIHCYNDAQEIAKLLNI
jgi:predicted adenine nucleotide alpha hydrolase (AANH) superfamily ATPase